MNQSVHNAFTLLLAPLQSSFTEVCRVFTGLLQFYLKLAINHRQWRKVRRGLSLPGKAEQKDPSKKSPKEGKYAVRIIDDKELYKVRKCQLLTNRQCKGNKSNAAKAFTDGEVNILYEKKLH